MSCVRASELHGGESSARPYAQHLEAIKPGRYVWKIALLADQATVVIRRWLESGPAELVIGHYDCTVLITDIVRIRSTSYGELRDMAFTGEAPRLCTLEFLTPLVFKKSGASGTWPWPEARLVAQSAMSRWNAFTTTSGLSDSEVLEEVASSIQPRAFNLRGDRVAMDGVGLLGTSGVVSYGLGGSLASRQVFHLCCMYAEYCALGAKTAMGLGATKYVPDRVVNGRAGPRPGSCRNL